MRIRAAVLEEFGEPLAVQEIDLAEPRAGEVLVRLHACGVCHTDLYTASGADPSGYAPTVLGHEGVGVVEAIGPDVTLLAPGDHVVTLFSPQCGECVHCRSERTNICLAIRDQQNLGYLPDGTARLSRDGEPIRHFMGCSTFAEYTVMPQIAPQLVRRYLDGEIDVDALISQRITLDEVNRAFELMEAQDGIRSVIDLT
jgi:S-(hydroxymethyl)glutathione dehydrogenase/alcohol dehydrogenase